MNLVYQVICANFVSIFCIKYAGIWILYNKYFVTILSYLCIRELLKSYISLYFVFQVFEEFVKKNSTEILVIQKLLFSNSNLVYHVICVNLGIQI